MSRPIDMRGFPLIAVEQLKVPSKYENDLKGILIPHGMVIDRIVRMAIDISGKDYSGSLLVLGLLDGAIPFYSDLIQRIEHAVEPLTLRAKSYAGTESTGTVEFSGFDFSLVTDRNVLVVEDIIDTGRTLEATVEKIKRNNPKLVEVACLLDKPSRREVGVNLQPDYLGFTIPDEFVVGFGLDYNNRYRDLKHISVLKEGVYRR